MSTWSTNIGNLAEGRRNHDDPAAPDAKSKLLEGKDGDDASASAVIFEMHATRDLGKDGVVLPQAGIEARSEPASPLPHDDGAAGDHVAVVRFYAEPLRIGIETIA